ncbi:DUF4397 domain-containing protein [Desulfotomaculum sp. 1211_IL3151]|uniref:DUF4397 domain-containing protein n=1 Tax=Desulfotomaculum sp. 1211_IL3151 TaxID=3084055 RepID=UPI002FDA5C29
MASYIRVLHASPDSPAVDVYANERTLAKTLTYRNFTEYIPLQEGNYNIKVSLSGSQGEAIVQDNMRVYPNSIYTVAVIGMQRKICIMPISDLIASVGLNINLKLVHLSPDTANLDIGLQNGTNLFKDVPYCETTNYITLPSGTYTFQVKVTDTDNVVLTVPNQKLTSPKVYTGYIVGLSNSNPPLQMLTPLDGSSYLNTNDSPSGKLIIDSKKADVNGDQVVDTVFLSGDKPDPTSPFTENLSVCVEDGKNNKIICTVPPSNAGYNANLFLGDFNDDNVADILIRIESGGSGGYLFAYVYTVLNNRLVNIFDYEDFNANSQYQVNFMDNYLVEVTQINNQNTFSIDLSNRKEEFSDIYDENGKLIQPLQGSVLPLGGLIPQDTDNDGNFELIAIQRIIGRFNAETLGYVKTTLDWDGTGFTTIKTEIVTSIDQF